MIKNNLLLDVPPGIGLLGMAAEIVGYCVVNGPDLLWGKDMKNWHPVKGAFEGIIGGPPCQEFSRMRHLLEAVGKKPRYGNMIPEWERIVSEAEPDWFLMENVKEAPIPEVKGYITRSFMLNPRWLGDIATRDRRFSFGSRSGWELRLEGFVLFENSQVELAVCGDPRPVPVKLLKNGKPKRMTVLASDSPAPGQRDNGGKYRTIQDCCEFQGLPRDFFGEFSPFKRSHQYEMIGNGVPLSMGKAVFAAIKRGGEGVTPCGVK